MRLTVPDPPAARAPRAAYRAYLLVGNAVRRNRALYRLLYGHWPAPEVHGQLWDWSTLALAAALRRWVRPGARVLDVGTGPAGVLAVYARHRLGCGAACGVDHVPELLTSAADTAARCGVQVDFRLSALFSAVQGRFDVIVFNAPYIQAEQGRRLGLMPDDVSERRWSGGESGLQTVEGFLRGAPGHLAPGGRILLGVNHFHVPSAAVRDAVARAGLVAVGTLRHRLTGACVYVLQPG